MIGLLKEEEAAVRKNAKSEPLRKAAEQGQLWLRWPGLVREALYETVVAAGLACVDEVLEAERSRLCGARYRYLAERQALRAGHLASSLVLGGMFSFKHASRAPAQHHCAALPSAHPSSDLADPAEQVLNEIGR